MTVLQINKQDCEMGQRAGCTSTVTHNFPYSFTDGPFQFGIGGGGGGGGGSGWPGNNQEKKFLHSKTRERKIDAQQAKSEAS